MKVGDLVKLKAPTGPMNSGTAGIIIKLFKKKCWRTQELGLKVNWDLIEPEPHAEVMINENVLNIPVSELELA
jgi:hypothetical protein